MFTKTSENNSKLDAEIGTLLDKLTDLDKESNEYGTVLDRLSKLAKLKQEAKPQKISPDTALVVAANLVGILAIINHERLHPITSKATSFILKA